MQPLLETIGNPRQDAADARYRAKEKAKSAAYLAQKQREARHRGADGRRDRRPGHRGRAGLVPNSRKRHLHVPGQGRPGAGL